MNSTMTDTEQLRKIFADLKQTASELENSDLSPSEKVFMLADALSEAIDGKAQYDTCERIDELAESSAILGDKLLSGSVALILKRGLTDIAAYENMGEMLSDLDIAEKMLKKLSRPEKPSAKPSKKKKLLEKPAVAMIGALYKMPVVSRYGGNRINVLVLGNNEYTRIFTDLCLQLCQIADRSLHILWVSEDCLKCRSDYFDEELTDTEGVHKKKRAALKEFVNIRCGQAAETVKEPYAELDFVSIKPEENPEASMTEKAAFENRKRLSRLLSDTAFDCVFVCMDSDLESFAAARAISEISPKSRLIYMTENNMVSFPGLFNAALENEYSISDIDSGLLRMAFNAHCAWSDNDDRQAMQRDYASSYNRLSSLIFAVSVQYKLLALGIDTADTAAAAEGFGEMCRKSSAIVRKMAAYEHRRWVIEKVTDGWQRLDEEDFAACLADCSDKDTVNRRHPCIVRCGENQPLSSPSMTRMKWENGSLDGYDELDAVSIKMHRAAGGLADTDKFTELDCFTELEEIFGSIRAADEGISPMNRNIRAHYNACRDPKYVFSKFRFCVRHILNGNPEYAIRSDEIFKELLECSTNADSGQRERITECVGEIKKRLFPVIFRCRYYDYKENDTDLIENIPFILTFPSRLNVIMAFEDGRNVGNSNDAVFANAASALVLRPDKITYLYVYNRRTNPDKFKRRLLNVVNFFISKNYFPAVDVLMLNAPPEGGRFPFKSGDALLPEYIDSFRIGSKPSEHSDMSCTLTVFGSFEEFGKAVDIRSAEYIYDGSTMLFSSSIENCRWIRSVWENFRYFEYISDTGSFVNLHGTDFLKYVRNKSYIKAENMLALNNAYLLHHGSVHGDGALPDYYDIYKTLWNICIYGSRNGTPEQGFSYTANSNTAVWNHTVSTIEKFQKTAPNKMQVRSCHLDRDAIKLLSLLENPDGSDSHDLAFIKNLTVSGENMVSFDFTDDRSRRLLEKAGEIFEVYCYYKALETGYFDDVISGYEFKWFEGNVTNESDLILTKGSRTMIVECKMRKEIEQDFLSKLDSLSSSFGINCRSVLVSYNYMDDTPYIGNRNATQRSRGAQLDISVVSDINDILNIGQTFIKIMENRYNR